MEDMLDRLRQDPGLRTLGQLLQERQWAVQEIARLRVAVGNAERTTVRGRPDTESVKATERGHPWANCADSPRLVRLKELCNVVGLSRSTIYAMMNSGRFPKSVHLGPRTAAWRIADILAWQASLR